MEAKPGTACPAAAGLLASADMARAVAKALRPTDARRIGEVLRRLAALWEAPELVGIPVALNPRLSRILGRLVRRPRRIELGPRALASEKRLREVVTHV